MGNSRAGRYHQRAARHEARARNYRRQAELLLDRDNDNDCAGALLYEAAKQCINAIANQLGGNPGTIGGKVNALRRIAQGTPMIKICCGTGKAQTSSTFTPTAAILMTPDLAYTGHRPRRSSTLC